MAHPTDYEMHIMEEYTKIDSEIRFRYNQALFEKNLEKKREQIRAERIAEAEEMHKYHVNLVLCLSESGHADVISQVSGLSEEEIAAILEEISSSRTVPTP